MKEIELGDRIQDRITKIKGIAVGITKWLYGCVRVTIQSEEVKDGKPVEMFCIDLPQCELLEKKVVASADSLKENVKRPAGPRLDASRGHDIKR